MAFCYPGDRPGKLISDPEVWFAANAQIDGVDPHSTIPADRFKYAVYQRRALVEALRTKALLLTVLNPEAAVDAAQKYFAAAMPTGRIEETIKGSIESAASWKEAGPLPSSVRAEPPGSKSGLVIGQKP